MWKGALPRQARDKRKQKVRSVDPKRNHFREKKLFSGRVRTFRTAFRWETVALKLSAAAIAHPHLRRVVRIASCYCHHEEYNNTTHLLQKQQVYIIISIMKTYALV